MGEKEITPASAARGDVGGLKIMKDPNESPPPPPAGGGRGREPKSGSVLYPDGYRWGKDEPGDDYLINPDGSKAYWDPTSETWKGANDGLPLPDDWSGGHRPPKYIPRGGSQTGGS